MRRWIGCAVSTGKKKLWIGWVLLPWGRGSSVSWGDEKFALSTDHEIMNSVWVNIVSRLHYQTQRFFWMKNSAQICSTSITAPSLTNVSLFYRYLPKWWGMGFFMICTVLFAIRDTFFVHAIQKFVARRKHIFPTSAFAKREIDWNSLPSDLFWI